MKYFGDNIMEPTSEQELKQLLEEGKISEDEYRQLWEAILNPNFSLEGQNH